MLSDWPLFKIIIVYLNDLMIYFTEMNAYYFC